MFAFYMDLNFILIKALAFSKLTIFYYNENLSVFNLGSFDPILKIFQPRVHLARNRMTSQVSENSIMPVNVLY